MIPTLETARLILRPPAQDDALIIARQLDNFAVSGNLARVPFPYTMADARAWLRTRRDDLPPEDSNFAIHHPKHGLIGMVGYHSRENEAVLGYWLAEPYWGRGYMTEAATTVLDWYFGTTDAGHVLSGVFVFNPGSLAVQRKLGFVETGRSVIHCLARGEDVAHIDTQLGRDAWMGKR